jgi:hypothetical protein
MLSESLTSMADSLRKSALAIKRLTGAMEDFLVKTQSYPHRRSYYLIYHGSPRVRKKNIKRYKRWFKKEMFQHSQREDCYGVF